MKSWFGHRAFWLMALASIAGVAGTSRADLITFANDPIGSKPNGFMSADSALVSFTDSVGAQLQVSEFSPQSMGRALAVNTDTDGSILIMNFIVPVSDLSLMFGNDDPAYTSPGDLALLTLFDGATQVGQVAVVLNRNDVMDQAISFSEVPFDRATFAYTDPNGSPFTRGPGGNIGLIEIVDNINFTPVPEPASLSLLGLGTLGLLSYGWRQRKRAKAVRS